MKFYHKLYNWLITTKIVNYFIQPKWFIEHGGKVVFVEKVRPDAITYLTKNGYKRKFYTFRAFLRHYFQAVPLVLYRELKELYKDPKFAMRGAIAYDASTGVESSTNPQTLTHTATGSNRLAIINFNAGPNGATATACSYAGTDALTNSSTSGNALGGTNYVTVPTNQNQYMFFLVAPSTSAGSTVSGTSSGSGYNILSVITYTGVTQTNPIDSSASNTVSAGTSLTVTTTVVASNCWLTSCFRNDTGVGFTGGTQTTVRINEPSGGGACDSNGTVGTGSQTQNVTWSGNANCAGIAASIAPVSSGPANVKTFDGVAIASVKTINGVAIASVKSVIGVN